MGEEWEPFELRNDEKREVSAHAHRNIRMIRDAERSGHLESAEARRVDQGA